MNYKVENQEIDIIVYQKNITRIQLQFTNNKQLIIKSRNHLSEEEVINIIESNINWIKKQLNTKRITLAENEMLFFGKKYFLVCDEVTDDYYFDGEKIYYSKKGLEKLYIEAYKEIAAMFTKINEQYAFKVDLKFRKMKSKWGSCHIYERKIVLNRILIHLPKELIEYIIYHEFSHFKYPNHSKNFYNEVAKYVPNYKKLQKSLKEYSFLAL